MWLGFFRVQMPEAVVDYPALGLRKVRCVTGSLPKFKVFLFLTHFLAFLLTAGSTLGYSRQHTVLRSTNLERL